MACVNEAAMAADTFDRAAVDIRPVALQARSEQGYVDHLLDRLVQAIDRHPAEAMKGAYLEVLNKDDYSCFRLPTDAENELVRQFLLNNGWRSATFAYNDGRNRICVYLSPPFN